MDFSDSTHFLNSVHPGKVVHVVGQTTDAVLNFLGPTTEALAEGGYEQVLLTYEHESLDFWALRLDPAVKIVCVPASRNPLVRWARMAARLGGLVSNERLATVHLHGLIPSLIGAPHITRLVRDGTRVYMSPHSSKSLRSLSWLGRPAFWLLSVTLPRQAQRAIANVPFDVRALNRISSRPVSLIESPVADIFFSVRRSRPARAPLVVGSGLAEGGSSVTHFAQLAILLSDENLGVSFNWIAPALAHDLAPLDAADVGVFAGLDDESRAERLAAAWIYVMAGPTRGFPLPLAEAMAVGLPCVVLDCEAHRDMIRHGETGLLCPDILSMMRAVEQLIISPELRQQLGTAARKEALFRFHSDDFYRRVFQAYSHTEEALARPDAHRQVRGAVQQ
jgi:hypothetical protein